MWFPDEDHAVMEEFGVVLAPTPSSSQLPATLAPWDLTHCSGLHRYVCVTPHHAHMEIKFLKIKQAFIFF